MEFFHSGIIPVYSGIIPVYKVELFRFIVEFFHSGIFADQKWNNSGLKVEFLQFKSGIIPVYTSINK